MHHISYIFRTGGQTAVFDNAIPQTRRSNKSGQMDDVRTVIICAAGRVSVHFGEYDDDRRPRPWARKPINPDGFVTGAPSTRRIKNGSANDLKTNREKIKKCGFYRRCRLTWSARRSNIINFQVYIWMGGAKWYRNGEKVGDVLFTKCSDAGRCW